MSDIISVDTIRNGFLIEDNSTFAGPKYAKTIGNMIIDVLEGLFKRYYYMDNDDGMPSEEWQDVMNGIREFVKYNEPTLIRKWKENAERYEKEHPEPPTNPTTTLKATIVTEEGSQDI